MDKSLKSVIVTIWKEQAETIGAQLDPLDNPVLVLKKMRITDYNGVSVSGAYASSFEVEPAAHPEVAALRLWWDSEGHSATFAPAGTRRLGFLTRLYAIGCLAASVHALHSAAPCVHFH